MMTTKAEIIAGAETFVRNTLNRMGNKNITEEIVKSTAAKIVKEILKYRSDLI